MNFVPPCFRNNLFFFSFFSFFFLSFFLRRLLAIGTRSIALNYSPNNEKNKICWLYFTRFWSIHGKVLLHVWSSDMSWHFNERPCKVQDRQPNYMRIKSVAYPRLVRDSSKKPLSHKAVFLQLKNNLGFYWGLFTDIVFRLWFQQLSLLSIDFLQNNR